MSRTYCHCSPNPWQFTVHKIWESPEITSSKNKYCPTRSDSPRKSTVRKTMSLQKLLAQRSSTVRRDCQSPAITGSKNMNSPARAWNPRQLLSGQIFLRTVDLRMNTFPEFALLRKTVLVPGTILIELCWNEAPLRRPFLKILYENEDKKKNNLDAETLKTS